MFVRQAIEPRDEFIHARVVFHGAGTERIHAEINRVIPCGEPREVADHFDLADFGKAFDCVAREFRAERIRRINCRYIERRKFHAALARRGLLEDQAFVLADVRARFAYILSTGASISVILEFKSDSSLNGSFENAPHSSCETFDFRSRRRFGDAD